jgi:subfamily B ATP-binding cassette protein MsbA
MKTYFRLLSFAKPIGRFAVPYILSTLLYVIFSTSVLVLLGPLMNTLFHVGGDAVQAAPKMIAKPALLDLSGWFKYYLQYFLVNYNRWTALKFVCAVIVVSVFLGNFFRYLSQRIMENLRVYTLLNLRRSVFNNVMNLHMGYFNNERKGDILTKVASDVVVVQFSVTGTLQVVFKEPLQLIGFLVAFS